MVEVKTCFITSTTESTTASRCKERRDDYFCHAQHKIKKVGGDHSPHVQCKIERFGALFSMQTLKSFTFSQ
jgi:hypothetical protein